MPATSREMRTLSRWLWAAVAAALVLAFALEQRGTTSALAAVQQQRAELSPQVRSVLAARSDLEQDTEAVVALAEREATTSRASGIVAAVAVVIPSGTSLTALSVSGDSVTIEGESKRSAAVYDALRALPDLERVRLGAPLRQERLVGDEIVERFVFNARIRGMRGATK